MLWDHHIVSFEGHNPLPLFFSPPLSCKAPSSCFEYFQPPFLYPRLETNFFNGSFFFSFNLKMKEKFSILDISIPSCINFYTLLLSNKLLIKKDTIKEKINKTK